MRYNDKIKPSTERNPHPFLAFVFVASLTIIIVITVHTAFYETTVPSCGYVNENCNKEITCGQTTGPLAFTNGAVLNLTYPGKTFKFTVFNWMPFGDNSIVLCYQSVMPFSRTFPPCPPGYIVATLFDVSFGVTEYQWREDGKISKGNTHIIVFPFKRTGNTSYIMFPQVTMFTWVKIAEMTNIDACLNQSEAFFSSAIMVAEHFASNFLLFYAQPTLIKIFEQTITLFGF